MQEERRAAKSEANETTKRGGTKDGARGTGGRWQLRGDHRRTQKLNKVRTREEAGAAPKDEGREGAVRKAILKKTKGGSGRSTGKENCNEKTDTGGERERRQTTGERRKDPGLTRRRQAREHKTGEHEGAETARTRAKGSAKGAITRQAAGQEKHGRNDERRCKRRPESNGGGRQTEGPRSPNKEGPIDRGGRKGLKARLGLVSGPRRPRRQRKARDQSRGEGREKQERP